MAGSWGHRLGLQKLTYINDDPAWQGPAGLDLGPKPSTSEFLYAFRHYAENNVEAELLEDRKEVWKFLGLHAPHDFQRRPREPWWVLKTSEDLREYRYLLMEDLQCDYASVSFLVQLVRKGPVGHMECLRILHHLLKDKSLASTYPDPCKAMPVQNSKWLKNACLEALDALAHPDDWEKGPAHNAKGASKRCMGIL